MHANITVAFALVLGIVLCFRPVLVGLAGFPEPDCAKDSAQSELNPKPACSPTSAAAQEVLYVVLPDGSHTYISVAQLDDWLPPISPEVTPELSAFQPPACAVHAAPSPTFDGMHLHQGAATCMHCRLLHGQPDPAPHSACSPSSAAAQEGFHMVLPDGSHTCVSAAQLDDWLPPISPEMTVEASPPVLPACTIPPAPPPTHDGMPPHEGVTTGMHFCPLLRFKCQPGCVQLLWCRHSVSLHHQHSLELLQLHAIGHFELAI